MKTRLTLATAALLLGLGSPVARASHEVRFKEVNPGTDIFVLKNYGTATVDVSSWAISSYGASRPVVGISTTVESGSPVLAPGAEVAVRLLDPHYLSLVGDELGIFGGPGSLDEPAAMTDYVQWGKTGGHREITAVQKGIWPAGGYLPIGDVYRYGGDGSDTGDRFPLWTSRSINVRLLRVDPADGSFVLKNFDTESIDISQWAFTAGLTNYGIFNSFFLAPDSGTTVIPPGGELTLRFADSSILDPAGGDLSVNRGGIVGQPPGLVDYVQWIVPGGYREPGAVAKGIWTDDAALAAAPVYTYDGDGTDTGPREVWWNTGGIPPAQPLAATLSFDPSGRPRIDFTTVPGRVYEVQRSSDLATWQPATQATATSASSSWTDVSAGGAARRFYKVIDVTP